MAKSLTIPKMNTKTAGFGFLADEVKNVLTHELFHIYSNTHIEERENIYETVGFYPIQLNLEAHQQQIIANPDADNNWAIELEKDGETIEAVLLTFSKYEKWIGNKSTLGLKPAKGYLDYGLFEVENNAGVYTLSNGLRKLENEAVESSFREKIGHHTDYTWAVEEIVADTFPLVVKQAEAATGRDKEILTDLGAVLR